MNLTDDQVRELCGRRDLGVLAAAATSEPAAAALVKDVPSDQLRMLIDDGVQARNTLVEANTGLAANIVNRTVRDERHRQDYLQESMLALINAADRYDPNRGASLTTYAYPHIKGAVLNLMNTRGGDLHLTNGQARAKELVRAAADQLTAAGTPAGAADVAEHFGRSEEWVRRYESYRRPTPLSSAELGDIQIPDAAAQQQVEAVSDKPMAKYLAMLPDDERTALELVHGFAGERYTLEEVSKIMGVSLSTLTRRIASGHASLGRIVEHFDQSFSEGQVASKSPTMLNSIKPDQPPEALAPGRRAVISR